MSVEPLKKSGYHHGNLAEALIDAALQLVAEKGEDFSLADASRIAGVSKGAPYRHFDSKDALLLAVIRRGFTQLAEAGMKAVQPYEPGTDDRIIALGNAYIDFATQQPSLFRLMFASSMPPGTKKSEKTGYEVLVSELAVRTGLSDKESLVKLARPLWTLVHGASMLTIDNNYIIEEPSPSTEEMVRDMTQLILAKYNPPETPE